MRAPANRQARDACYALALACEIQNGDSFFSRDFLLRESALAGRQTGRPETDDCLLEKIRGSRGVRLLFIASFHDAIILDAGESSRYGRYALELFLDFSGTMNAFAAGRRFRLLFTQADPLSFPPIPYGGQTGILSSDIACRNGRLELRFDLIWPTGEGWEEDCLSICCEDILVNVEEKKPAKRRS